MGRIIAYSIFSVMVVGALMYMVYDNIRFAAASAWQSVEGHITESAVISNGGGTRTAPTYSASVAYIYTAGGRNFTGHSIWLTAGSSFITEEDAETFLRPYRVGSQVRVFHDPGNPADSALIVERGGDPMVLIIIAGLWGLIGTYHFPRHGPSDDGEAAQRPEGRPSIAGNARNFPPKRPGRECSDKWGSRRCSSV